MNWNEVIGSSALVPLFSSGVALAVPTATAAVGECFSERAGNLNLGVEGMMLTGAFAGFIGTYYTHSVAVGVLCGIGAGVLLGVVMAGLSIWLKTEQVINGIALVLFAQGLTAFLYGKLFSTNNTPTISTPGNLHVPLLADIPVIGHVLFRQNSLFYIAVAAMLGVIFVLYRTRFGLSVRATGEDPAAADAAAIPVDRVRWIALLVGGATAGLGGAVLVVGQLGIIQTNVHRRRRVDRGGARHLRSLEPGVRDRRRVPVRNHRRAAAADSGREWRGHLGIPVRVLPGSAVPRHAGGDGCRRDWGASHCTAGGSRRAVPKGGGRLTQRR